MPMPDPQVLVAGVVIAVVAAVLLAAVFGVTRRTIAAAIGLTIGIGAFYPGGTAGLLVDVLRPLSAFVQGEKDRGAVRDAAVGEAADGQAPASTR